MGITRSGAGWAREAGRPGTATCHPLSCTGRMPKPCLPIPQHSRALNFLTHPLYIGVGRFSFFFFGLQTPLKAWEVSFDWDLGEVAWTMSEQQLTYSDAPSTPPSQEQLFQSLSFTLPLAVCSRKLPGFHQGHVTQGWSRQLFPKHVCFKD